MNVASKTNGCRPFLGAAILLFAVLALAPAAQSGGLRCSVGEVVITNLKIGQTYSLKKLVNLPLSVTNTANQPVIVRVEPQRPAPGELKQGAEQIPDVAWAKAVPDSFQLAPQETEQVEMILSIPDDERLFGKKYQVAFWSHTLAQAGDLLAYGLSSRVIFSIDQVRETPGAVLSGELAISLLPAVITLENVRSGRRYQLEDFLQKPLTVKNSSEKELSVELQTLDVHKSATTLPPGYADLLGSAMVKLTPEKFTLQPGEEKIITGTVSFPKGEPLTAKKFMGVVSAAVVGQAVQTQIYSRIYAHTR